MPAAPPPPILNKTEGTDSVIKSPRRRLGRIGVGVLLLALSAVALFLSGEDWNWARGPIGHFASARLHRSVAISGKLRVHLWSLNPTATIEQLTLGNPSWASVGQTAQVDRMVVQVRLLALMRGRLILSRLDLIRPVFDLHRDISGRSTWNFSNPEGKAAPFKMPAISRFVIESGRMKLIDDQRKLSIEATLEATESRGKSAPGFQLSGAGALNGKGFGLKIRGGPLLSVDPERPYPFSADIQSGATRVLAQGLVLKPFNLGGLSVDLTADGPDLEQLYDLTGVSFPNTPPYRLMAHLRRDGHVYRLDQLHGRVGDSDLAGAITVDGRGARPLLTADLITQKLDFDDLAALFGGAPSTRPGETVSPEERAIARALKADVRLLPDATLKVDRIRALDADIQYQAITVHDAVLPLTSARVHVRLDHGLLTADALRFGLPKGDISGRVRLDARGAVPITNVDLSVSNARLEQIIPIRAGNQPLRGSLRARIKLRGQGTSVHRAAANADGEVLVVVPNGEIRSAFAELLGIDLTRGLGLLLAGDEGVTPIRCAMVDFKASKGLLRADHLVFDTGPVLVDGHGTLDLAREWVDLQLQGHPKSLRLVRLKAPITIKGKILGPPKVSINTGSVLRQAGLAAVLSTAITPLGGLLPFLDAGFAKDAPCGALVAQPNRYRAPG